MMHELTPTSLLPHVNNQYKDKKFLFSIPGNLTGLALGRKGTQCNAQADNSWNQEFQTPKLTPSQKFSAVATKKQHDNQLY